MKIRLLSFWLTVFLMVSIICNFPVSVNAATYSGECGDNVTWKLNTGTGVLTIYGEGEMYYETDYAPWCDYADVIKKAVIQDGVTSIYWGAFGDCYNMTRVEIGADIETIEEWAFDFCNSLSEFYVDEDNEYYCSVDGNLFDKYMGILVKYAPGKSEETYRIPDGVIELSYDAFAAMSKLERVEIPSSVEYLDPMAFLDNWGLKEITVDEDNEYYCSVDGVLFDKDKTALLKYPSAKSGTHYEIPDGVNCIDVDAFNWAQNLESVYIADSVTEICEGAFWGCESLTKVNIPKNMEIIEGYAFYLCDNLSEVYFDGTEAEWGQIEIGKDNECLTDATIYFEATMPDGVKYSGTCGDDLTWSLSEDGVLTISGSGDMYDYGNEYEDNRAPWSDIRDSITEVVIGDNVTGIGADAFFRCYNLYSVEIPESVERIGESAFFECIILEEVIIPKNVKSIGDYAFFSCVALKNVSLEEGLEVIGNGAFISCESLEEIVLPESLRSIGEDAFWWSALQEIVIPKGVIEMGEYAFAYCYVKTAEVDCDIAVRAFFECWSLKSVYIGTNVKNIGDEAFVYCYSLTDVYYAGSEEEWNSINLGEANEYLLNATIHYNSEATLQQITNVTVLDDGKVEVELEGYEAGGRVVGIMMDGNEAVAVRSKDAAENVELDFSGVSGTTVKVFWWEGFGSIEPVCEAVEVRID